jgi:hypothetical protein
MMPTKAQVTKGGKLADIAQPREAENLRKQLKNIPWLNAEKVLFAKDFVCTAGTTSDLQHSLGHTPDGTIITHYGGGFVFVSAADEQKVTFQNDNAGDVTIRVLVF